MLSQFLNALMSSIVNRIVSAFHSWSHIKFYFIGTLIFLLSLGFIYREVVTMTIQNVVFNEIRFRECRDLLGLQKAFDNILVKDTILTKYVVYLYQPINNSFYKKAILTNDEIIMSSPSLQGIYLKDQPTLNKELNTHDYYMVAVLEAARHPDLQFMIDISMDTRLFYALKVNGKVIGEISVRYKHPPSVLEVEQTLRELSPLLYNYIL